MTTVYAAPGTSYTSDNHLPTWQGVKHVEQSRSEIKVTTQLYRVGLFNNDRLTYCIYPVDK